MRTARSRTSGENFGDFLMAPFSRVGASSKPRAVHLQVSPCLGACHCTALGHHPAAAPQLEFAALNALWWPANLSGDASSGERIRTTDFASNWSMRARCQPDTSTRYDLPRSQRVRMLKR
jgi:hypothetical protein